MLLQNALDSRILFVSVVCLFAVGCGDDVIYPPGLGPGTQVETGQPPAAPKEASMPDGSRATFAISKLILGRNDTNGTSNKELWKTIGYNLDFTVTTKTSSGVAVGDSVCARINGASFDTIADGNNGRDNAFGSTVLPILLSVHPEIEKTSNAQIQQGKHSLLIDVQGLGSAPTYESLTVRLYEAREFTDAQGMPAKPVFDGSDVWPIAFESVNEGMLDKPRSIVTDGYVAAEGVAGTLVAQFDESIVLTLDALPVPDGQGIMQIRIRQPILSMRFSADRSHVDSGTLAGTIDTAELDEEVARLTGVIDNKLCHSETLESIRQLVRQSSDILADRQSHANLPCNSISIGIQFEATQAQLGAVLPPAAPPTDPCATP
jgi:hypothetical protein